MRVWSTEGEAQSAGDHDQLIITTTSTTIV